MNLILYILLGIVLIIIGWAQKSLQVRRNYFLGYRTPRALKNDANWNFANKYSGKLMLWSGVLSTLVGFLVWYLEILSYLYISIFTIILLVIIIAITEYKLYKFDQLNSKRY